MKSLKITMVLAVLLSIGTFAVAQDYSEYLNTALTLLDKGDCDNAERNYNVYKKLTGKSSALVEKGLAECKGSNKQTDSNFPKQIQINYQNYEVLPGDLDGTYTWTEAKSACDNLTAFGHADWYLPDKNELGMLYRNKSEIGNFDGWYWSSTESVSGRAMYYSFGNGHLGDCSQKDNGFVRCIRKSK